MENPEDSKKKKGVVPRSELQGSDADKAYNEQGEIPKLDENTSGTDANEQRGADADEDGNK